MARAAPAPETPAPETPAPETIDTDWYDDAACRGADTSVFFPRSDEDAGEAKAICATCPVAAACLEYAIVTRQPDGVWGGLTAVERRRLVRRRQKAARKARAQRQDAAA